ncbi:MAG: asparagine--tRNA ligase, partial [Bacteroidales bacterium]|nr:asparagine--tRNA ligase [Bacteroidales bacterium]
MKDFKRTKIADLIHSENYGKVANVKGWVRTKRGSKNVSFIALNDGSTIHNIQIVVDHQIIHEDTIQHVHSGASLSVTGKIIKSQGSGQNVEINAQSIEVLGVADPDQYPLQPKRHTLEFLREKAHLRFRTNTF